MEEIGHLEIAKKKKKSSGGISIYESSPSPKEIMHVQNYKMRLNEQREKDKYLLSREHVKHRAKQGVDILRAGSNFLDFSKGKRRR